MTVHILYISQSKAIMWTTPVDYASGLPQWTTPVDYPTHNHGAHQLSGVTVCMHSLEDRLEECFSISTKEG